MDTTKIVGNLDNIFIEHDFEKNKQMFSMYTTDKADTLFSLLMTTLLYNRRTTKNWGGSLVKL